MVVNGAGAELCRRVLWLLLLLLGSGWGVCCGRRGRRGFSSGIPFCGGRGFGGGSMSLPLLCPLECRVVRVRSSRSSSPSLPSHSSRPLCTTGPTSVVLARDSRSPARSREWGEDGEAPRAETDPATTKRPDFVAPSSWRSPSLAASLKKATAAKAWKTKRIPSSLNLNRLPNHAQMRREIATPPSSSSQRRSRSWRWCL